MRAPQEHPQCTCQALHALLFACKITQPSPAYVASLLSHCGSSSHQGLMIRPFECCLVLTQNMLTLPLVSCSTQGKESCPRLQPHSFMSRCPRRCSTLGTRHRQAPQILPGSQSSAAAPRCRQTLCRTGCLPAEIPALFSGKALFRRPCPAHGASDDSSSHAISTSNL